ncbi:MFS transporter [Nakamurella antarctica]|uniref:MFS transporter n=1 Tax=Nakamurella antarctica TaxID=1902245 RepID=A0A3G8ZK15_9ACTN|nr:MFS transporter [Nakamurella antarctica]AZI57127.1 MFS transporter [Nakamurella antarctica]
MPGSLLFSLTGLFARLQMSMAGMGATLLIVHERDSYSLAALVTAVFALAAAFIGPQVSRLVDRFGQHRIVPLQLSVHVPAILALIFVAYGDGLEPLLLGLALVAGSSQLSVGAMIRARWSKIYTGTPLLRTAFAVESLVDEVVFITGPPLATVLALQVAPSAALLVATLILTVGSVLLILQRSTQPVPSGTTHPAPKGSALFLPGVGALAGIMVFVGAVFGSFEITTIAVAQDAGAANWTGLLLAVYSFGSLIGGFAYGAREFRAHLPRQFIIAVTALGIVTLPLAAMGNLVLLGIAAAVAGFAVAPVLISVMSLVEYIVPAKRLTESITWATGGLSVGLAGGLLISGAIVDNFAASNAYLVTSGAAVLAFVSAYLIRGVVGRAYQAAYFRGAQALQTAAL